MHSIDLNLLVALDALLEHESVQEAAAILHLSPSAMSRTLSRIRDALGDEILVRAGRRLVPTPRAQALRPRVRELVEEARAVFAPEGADALASAERIFTIRADDALAGLLAGPLGERIRSRAPGVVLRFAGEGEEDVGELRDGRVDLDLGVQGPLGPEIRLLPLFEDTYVGVVREGHPLEEAPITLESVLAHPHVSVSRRGRRSGPFDEALARLGLERFVSTIVPTFNAALLALCGSDLVAAMPSRLAARAGAWMPLRVFDLGVELPRAEIAAAWHPRFQNDPVHRWARTCLRELGLGDRIGA